MVDFKYYIYFTTNLCVLIIFVCCLSSKFSNRIKGLGSIQFNFSFLPSFLDFLHCLLKLFTSCSAIDQRLILCTYIRSVGLASMLCFSQNA